MVVNVVAKKYLLGQLSLGFARQALPHFLSLAVLGISARQ
jgi:hypothetical protein